MCSIMTTRTTRRIISIVLVVLVVLVPRELPLLSLPLTIQSRLAISSLFSLKQSSRLIPDLLRWPDMVAVVVAVDMVEEDTEVAVEVAEVVEVSPLLTLHPLEVADVGRAFA